MIFLHREFDQSNVSGFWNEFNFLFHHKVETEGLDKFLSWNLVKSVMFHDIKKEAFDSLRASSFWGMFLNAGQLDGFGAKPSKYFRKCSGNLLHHMYSLNEFLNFSPKTDLKALNTVYEFGGGYGSLCRLFYRLGFKGKYIILDNPLMSTIQDNFLKKTVPDQKVSSVLGDMNIAVDMAIALWSLSECPIKAREKFFKTKKFKKCLIAFQKKFAGIDNLKYFKKLVKDMNSYRWKLYEIKHLPGNYYLLGDCK